MSDHRQRERRRDRRRSRRSHRRAIALAVTVIALICASAGGAAAPPAHAVPATLGGPSWYWYLDGAAAKYDSFQDCARCPNGSLVAAGYQDTVFPSASGDFAVAKYSAFGLPIWSKSWDGPSHLRDEATAVAVDRAGSIVVAGLTAATTTGDDIAVVKWSPSGELRWATVWNGEQNDTDASQDVVVDARGDVLVCGYAGASEQAVVLKLRGGTGEVAWRQLVTNPPGTYAIAYAVVVDGSRNVYVTGYRGSATGEVDVFLNKYSPSGKVVWQRRYDSPSHLVDEGSALCLAAGPALYVAGVSETAANGNDALLLKYDLAGHRKWVRSWDGDAHKSDHATVVAADAAGNPVIAGATASGGPIGDMALLVKYGGNGALKWDDTWYNEYTDGYARHYALVVSGTGRIWTGGVTDVGGGQRTMVVSRYSPAGTHQWARVWNPTAKGSDLIAMVSAGSSGLLVAGQIPVVAGNTNGVAGVFAK